ncbi:sugar phosphate nucleotidyltransferase [Thermoactinomyces sp. DSM 45892]|uniref:sugar phosphate nucleotidyltransferase n=1 Tax=Thermoactinomyces sp. DSM 45892 TaxID=1882753 RepID=UPI000896E8FD|nr:sugar phosphate nucleotidyltransferase [Thermoactinomyces sp. DSM 45892]SDY99573.1 glucose-1-phosphate thymidylyltransferase [Thermoactinomyces sp. DSM 45892]
MKGVILAGGTGSRLYPLTKVTNKHLLPVGNTPMIYHPIKKLIEAGIREICIVTGVEHMGEVVRLLGSGEEFEAEFTYRVQDKPGGIAQALYLARHFTGDDLMVVLLGDNVFADSIKPYVEDYMVQGSGAKILLKEVEHPQRFGVAELDGNRVRSIEEKPQKPKSSYCVTGVYMYDSKVYQYIEQLEPSKRGEYEITDINNKYIEEDICSYNILSDWWTDAGTFESLIRANQFASQIK